MSEQIIITWVAGTYLACTVAGFAFRGWIHATERKQIELHFFWPVFLIAIPVGVFYLFSKAVSGTFHFVRNAASHGLRILKIRKGVKP